MVIEAAGYFGKIGALLRSVPKRVLANYLVLRHVVEMSGATPEKMRLLQGIPGLVGARLADDRSCNG